MLIYMILNITIIFKTVFYRKDNILKLFKIKREAIVKL